MLKVIRVQNTYYLPTSKQTVRRWINLHYPALKISEPQLAQLTTSVDYIRRHKGDFEPKNIEWLHAMLDFNWPVEEIIYLIS